MPDFDFTPALEKFHARRSEAHLEREMLEKVIRAWDNLPTGHYRPRVVESWLNEKLWPVIKEIRSALDNGQPTSPKEMENDRIRRR